MAIYPKHEWQLHRFATSPQGFWKDHAKVRKFLDSAAAQLDISSDEDWYRVSINQLQKLGGSGIDSIGGIGDVSRSIFT